MIPLHLCWLVQSNVTLDVMFPPCTEGIMCSIDSSYLLWDTMLCITVVVSQYCIVWNSSVLPMHHVVMAGISSQCGMVWIHLFSYKFTLWLQCTVENHVLAHITNGLCSIYLDEAWSGGLGGVAYRVTLMPRGTLCYWLPASRSQTKRSVPQPCAGAQLPLYSFLLSTTQPQVTESSAAPPMGTCTALYSNALHTVPVLLHYICTAVHWHSLET